MAEKGIQNTTQVITNNFSKGLNKDTDPSYVESGLWTHARNIVNNTDDGDLGTISNENSNYLCGTTGETMLGDKDIIGTIHLYSDKWVIFTVAYNLSGMPVNSEIGLFEEDSCRYRPIVSAPCLNFSKFNLITGASREKGDCKWQVYWADGLNPDRYLTIGDNALWPDPAWQWGGSTLATAGPTNYNNYINNTTGALYLWPIGQWVQDCDPVPGSICEVCVDTNHLDCNAIRLAPLVTTPCVQLSIAPGTGTLENGSYFALVAYCIKQQKVTNYFSPSNLQPIFTEKDLSQGTLLLNLELDTVNFDTFELVIVRSINENVEAKKIGYYSTNQNVILLDEIPQTLETVPLSYITLQNPVYETSDQMVNVGQYLLRIAPRSKFDFNYQPLANLIRTRWVSVEYPETYYINGGSKTGYLRDEVYSFFIRWVYDTGDKSASYHIPGRANENYAPLGMQDIAPYVDQDSFADNTQLWETINTASQTITYLVNNPILPDGGKVLAKGKMGYWESTEFYPADQPEIWNSSSHCWTATTNPNYDLCGTPIRHHKFPDNALSPETYHFNVVGANAANGTKFIRIMSVEFDTIILPKDNDGNYIEGIVGYEILRGSREGNQSIVAKGMINNFRTYNILGQSSGNRTGLYANYPFNCTLPLGNTLNQGDHDYRYNDPFIKPITLNSSGNSLALDQLIPTNLLSFTSPDTSFRNPFLNQTELKIYGSLQGNSEHFFGVPNKHPENKLMSDEAFYIAVFVGLGNALLNMLGKQETHIPAIPDFQVPYQKYPEYLIAAGAGGTTGVTLDMAAGAVTAANAAYTTFQNELTLYFSTGGTLTTAATVPPTVPPSPVLTLAEIYEKANKAFQNAGLYSSQILVTDNTVASMFAGVPVIGPYLSQAVMLPYYFAEGFSSTLRIIQALLPYRQYALQSYAHGFYARFVAPSNNFRKRFSLEDGLYLTDSNQQVPDYLNNAATFERFTINNLNRTKTVFLRTSSANNTDAVAGPNLIGNYVGGVLTPGFNEDNSLINLGKAVDAGLGNGMAFDNDSRFKSFLGNIASHYVGLKYNVENQYGKIENIKQVIATSCEYKFDPNNIYNAGTNPNGDIQLSGTSFFCPPSGPTAQQVIQKLLLPSGPIFGGDTYINRFTEKNTQLFFYNWLYNLPDGTPWNYLLYNNIPQARYWMNSQPYTTTDFQINITSIINSLTPSFGAGLMPKSYYNLDNKNYDRETDNEGNYPGFMSVKNSYFYLANSGVRDFFVESNVLADFRSQGTFQLEQPYMPYSYTDMRQLFDINPDIITKGNFYNYNYSLSVTKFFTQYLSAGAVQGVNYDPTVAQLCFTYFPNRALYSLYLDDQSYDDNWFIYLPLNYVQFKDRITTIKSIGMTGMLFTFQTTAPLFYQGIDTLQTLAGKKVTIGDGGLFSNPPQTSSNSESSFEYGSSQNIFSVLYTPAGLYYVSMNQGKIFSYGDSLKEISQNGLKWWFTLFLPYKLILDFPDYPHVDNPVAGIGVQTMYDNKDSILYFTKKDYKLKSGLGKVSYNRIKDRFNYLGTDYPLGHPAIFDDASWTISFDPKSQVFISFHDWHPNLSLSSKSNVFSIKDNTIWKHNDTCDDFCNFYGTQYPFEIEYPINTGQAPTVVKSFEYILECFKSSQFNCVDQFQVLDENFTQAVVYNNEQVSGYLNLNIFPKNNVTLSLTYPKLNQSNLTSFDILFSKEENKYRFNQFWDITKDRGEFPTGSGYPPLGPLVPNTTVLLGNYPQEVAWNTEPNGYIKTLNANNLNYTKPEMQRKKFRNYLNYLFLSKLATDDNRDVNFILKIINSKNQGSPR
jgi:hypothetical protein